MALSASSGVAPMAESTRLRRTFPEEHAAPALTITPARCYAIADMLLELKGEDGEVAAAPAGNISSDSTVLDMALPQSPGGPAEGTTTKQDTKGAAVKQAANTSLAAKEILEKYLRRPKN